MICHPFTVNLATESKSSSRATPVQLAALSPGCDGAFQPGPPTPKEEFGVEERVPTVSALPPGPWDQQEFFAQRNFGFLIRGC